MGVQVDGNTCGSLLRELQCIWNEVGESDAERDEILLQLEQECLEVYRRKVEQASHARSRLYQSLTDSEVELSSLIAALGDHSLIRKQSEKRESTLKEQLAAVGPQLDELRQKKEQRMKQFVDVQEQIQKVGAEISGSLQTSDSASDISIDEQDLSLKKLDQYHAQLESLQKEKSERLNKILDCTNMVHELCSVLGMDYYMTITGVHPSLDESTPGQSRSISDSTLAKLAKTVQFLQQERRQRIQKLQGLGALLIELWNLMDTPVSEQQMFHHVTCIIGVLEADVTTPGALALENIEQAEVEVERLDQLKASKMKELVMKKQRELDEIYMIAHMEPDPETTQEKIMATIDSGQFDPSELLASMDQHIAKAKEAALSRKEIMDKMERWMSVCEEECWLEDYNRDENRYSASRGAHINLKRAERARATVNRIPALVDALMAKVKAWEEERGMPFVYDGMQLLAMLEEYNLLRQEKEEERRRLRDQKRLQGQLMTEQEAIFGTRPSPNKPLSAKKGLSVRVNGNSASPANRRLSLGGAMLQTGNADVLVSRMNGVTPVRLGKDGIRERARAVVPVNYVALSKGDSTSVPSVNGSEPASPMVV
eukprot:c47020_g1_i1 orf=422-2218(+)